MSRLDDSLLYGWQHRFRDVAKLLLQKRGTENLDIEQVARQIEGYRQALHKWPSLVDEPAFAYPPRVNREQSSSEATADYKSRLIQKQFPERQNLRIADLTGGMGIDSLCFARTLPSHVYYCEQNEELCQLMEHNTKALRTGNLSVVQGDSITWIEKEGHIDVVYIDPSRRDAAGKKVVLFSECLPNLVDVVPMLRKKSRMLIVKASPMIDIKEAQREIGVPSEIHIVAHRGECKEVLMVWNNHQRADSTKYVCVNLDTQDEDFAFTPTEMNTVSASQTNTPSTWIYKPNAAIMKSGAFALVASRYGLLQLGHQTHLFTSTEKVDNFPGRIFRVEQEIALNRKEIRRAIPSMKAHVMTANFPTGAEELQKQLSLKEGGEKYIIAIRVEKKSMGLLCSVE